MVKTRNRIWINILLAKLNKKPAEGIARRTGSVRDSRLKRKPNNAQTYRRRGDLSVFFIIFK